MLKQRIILFARERFVQISASLHLRYIQSLVLFCFARMCAGIVSISFVDNGSAANLWLNKLLSVLRRRLWHKFAAHSLVEIWLLRCFCEIELREREMPVINFFLLIQLKCVMLFSYN